MASRLYNRRRFLQDTALFSASLAIQVTRARLTRADESVQAIVIGSGFGGAVAALRLGQAGIHTVVLERGRRWDITPDQDTFTTSRNPDGRAGWLTKEAPFGGQIDVYTGVLERIDTNGLSILVGAGVGGGSLNYYCGTLQPPRELFYRTFPKEINYEELDEVYFPRARSVLKPSIIPQDILASNYYLSSRVFIEQVNNAGFRHTWNVLNVDWNIIRQQIEGTKNRDIIIGEIDYGANSGAKNSVDRNYLTQAQQTGFVEILPLHVVTEIAEVPGNGYRIFYNQINTSGEVIASKSLTCRYLFLAAGSMGTSTLLVKAKAKGTLSRLNEYVGKGFSDNGDTFSIRSGLGITNPEQGGPAGAAVLEDYNNPFSPIFMINVPSIGAEEGTLRIGGFTLNSVKGRFQYDSATDSVKMHWPAKDSGNVQSLKATEYTSQILDKSNTTATYQPTSSISSGLTVHALGGAVIGQACDLYGRVKGYRGLYVVDGALIPGATGCVPPSLTIAALAERCMERILAEDILSD